MAQEKCIACIVDTHYECYTPDYEANQCCCAAVPTMVEVEQAKRGGPTKEDFEVTDVTSTGRKRAAIAYPLEEGMICEWAGLKFAGGGVEPIIGCDGKPATHRHHGPDKNTLNNNAGNVHRICVVDHNRWHTLNDKYYGDRPPGTEPFIPRNHEWKMHDAVTKATPEEIAKNEIYWIKNKTKRAGAD